MGYLDAFFANVYDSGAPLGNAALDFKGDLAASKNSETGFIEITVGGATAGLESRVSALETANVAVEADITALDGRVTVLEDSDFLEVPDVVVVASLSDLPAPVAGVITLAEDTTYLVRGRVSLGTNRIQGASGAALIGLNFTGDALERTGSPTGALLTLPAGIGNFVVDRVGLTTPSGAGTLFDVQGAGTNLFADNVDGSGDIGSFVGSVIRFSNSSFINVDSGASVGSVIAFTLLATNIRQASGGTGVLVDFTGTVITVIELLASTFDSDTGGTVLKGLASGGNLGSGAEARVNTCTATGTGTVLDTVTEDDIGWVFANCSGFPGSLACGSFKMVNNATSTPNPGVSVWTKVLGTTTARLQKRFQHASNRLTNLSKTPKLYKVEVILDATSSVNNTDADFGVSVNGADPVDAFPLLLSSTGLNPISFFVENQTLTKDDYIEVWVRNPDSAAITVADLTVLISAIATGT